MTRVIGTILSWILLLPFAGILTRVVRGYHVRFYMYRPPWKRKGRLPDLDESCYPPGATTLPDDDEGM